MCCLELGILMDKQLCSPGLLSCREPWPQTCQLSNSVLSQGTCAVIAESKLGAALSGCGPQMPGSVSWVKGTAGCSSGTPAGTGLVAVPLPECRWETLGPFFRGLSDLLCQKQVPKLRLWPGFGKISAMRMGSQLCGAKCQWNLICQGCFQDLSESTFVWVSVTASPLSRACHYFIKAPSGLCGLFHFPLSLLLGSRWCPKVLGLLLRLDTFAFLCLWWGCLAFKLPITTPPCNCDTVCGPEHTWLQDSGLLSMPGLVVCNLPWLCQSIWRCWDPLCLAGLSKTMSWVKAVVPACAAPDLPANRQRCPQWHWRFPGLAGMFCRGTTSPCHGSAGLTSGETQHEYSSSKRKWMEKYEWREQLLCWSEYGLR